MSCYKDGVKQCPCDGGGGGGYLAPAFTSFGIFGQPSPIEVGDQIAANPTFVWTTSNPVNIVANSIDIIDVTGGAINIATGQANTGSYAAVYPAIQRTSAGSWQFQINGQNTLPAIFTRTYDVEWQWMLYYGESANAGPLSEAQIEALRVAELGGSFARNYAMLAGGYKYICYPVILGVATNFIDLGTGFPVAMDAPYTVLVTNTFGQTTNYRVHRTYNTLGGALTIVVS